ncbi:hypothetical protein N6H14_33180 [Paenibacillus sp. CC-CFT747]|nr:hypothetical protein N6H14_33180 [Paenibacillus sp. CC-CFT747]
MKNAFNRQDEMIYLQDLNDSSYSNLRPQVDVKVYNRQAELVESRVMEEPEPYTEQISSEPASCRMVPGTIYKGTRGDFYRYQTEICTYQNGYTYSKGVYLEKINPDFTLGFLTRLTGKDASYAKSFPAGMQLPYDNPALLIINPMKNEVIARSWTDAFMGGSYHYQAVNMNTGWPAPFDGSTYEYFAYGRRFNIDGEGNYIDQRAAANTGTLTRDGLISRYDPNDSSYSNRAFKEDKTPYSGWKSGGLIHVDFMYGSVTYNQRFGEYFGDGLFLAMWNPKYGGNPPSAGWVPWISVGEPSEEPERFKAYQLGQFVSPFAVDDTEISFTMTMGQARVNREKAGFSFRMQDPRNRYAVETEGDALVLAKYADGNRTVLSSIPYPFQDNVPASFRIKLAGPDISVALNGVPYLTASDGTWPSGKLGPFADKSFVTFSGITTKAVPAQGLQWLTGYAIWEPSSGNATVKYRNIAFDDPEKDPPAGSMQWSYSHDPKFLDHQGVSAMAGQTYTAEQTTFDKVGVYTVSLRAKDDPHGGYPSPSLVFDSYRMLSNRFMAKVTVHRRPVAVFTAAANPDGTIRYTDDSYDPDRWAAPDRFSAPDTTGIDYGATRGIMERKWWYLSPSGEYRTDKLTRPAELGTYEVGLQVRDEYGAWSLPATRQVAVGHIPPPNGKPSAVLTYPTGTQAAPTMVHTAKPTVTWNQSDPDPGTVFKGYHVRISDPVGTVIQETGETSFWTSSKAGPGRCQGISRPG